MEFIEDTLIYKKRYIHQQLVTDYSKTYLITKLEKKETSFGTSYLALFKSHHMSPPPKMVALTFPILNSDSDVGGRQSPPILCVC